MASSYESALRATANYACDKCAELAGQRLRSIKGGRQAFYPNVDIDDCKFSVGIVDEYHYLVYQNDGFATFAMTSLRGKTIPIMSNGVLTFRKASRINEWRPGSKTYWRRNSDGELMASEEQRRAWVHPGLSPKNFLRDGAIIAARERAQEIYDALVDDFERTGTFDE